MENNETRYDWLLRCKGEIERLAAQYAPLLPMEVEVDTKWNPGGEICISGLTRLSAYRREPDTQETVTSEAREMLLKAATNAFVESPGETVEKSSIRVLIQSLIAK